MEIMTSQRIVVKLGTSTLTGGERQINRQRMLEIIQQIARLHQAGHEMVVVTSGAMAAGRERLGFPDLGRSVPAKQMLSAVGQGYLMHIYSQLFDIFSVVVGQVLLTRDDLGDRARYLNIRDTMACVELAVANPADRGELRVYNQFTEQFNVNELAAKVADAARTLGYDPQIQHVDNPRVEAEEHYYNAKHTKLLELGLEPNLLGPELIRSMLNKVAAQAERIDRSKLLMGVRWAPETRATAER